MCCTYNVRNKIYYYMKLNNQDTYVSRDPQ